MVSERVDLTNMGPMTGPTGNAFMQHHHAHLPSLWASKPMDWALVDLFGAREALTLAPAVGVWLTTVEGTQYVAEAKTRFPTGDLT